MSERARWVNSSGGGQLGVGVIRAAGGLASRSATSTAMGGSGLGVLVGGIQLSRVPVRELA